MKHTHRYLLSALAFGVAVATLIPACIPLDQDSSSSAGGSSSTGGRTGCDAQPTCADCTACATSGQCAALVSACNNDSACAGLDECIGFCGANTSCKQDCLNQNSAGLSAYNAAYSCLYCTACPNACSGYATCP